MPLFTSNSKQLLLESAWLRKFGWLFPVIGLPLGCVIDRFLWVAITLDTSFVSDSTPWLTLKGLLIGIMISMLPIGWCIGLKIEDRCGTLLRQYAILPLLTLFIFGLFEVGFRSFPGQEILWQSVRSRSGPDYFAREVSLLRLDEASRKNQQQTTPGIVVAGSSQMLHALDVEQLHHKTDLPVYRRAVAGMFPAELCAATDFLTFQPENTLLLMLSGFDLGGRDDLYTDAMRPMTTPSGFRGLVDSANPTFLRSHWRSFVDLAAASVLDTWRSRDYIRLIFAHPMTPKRESKSTLPLARADQNQQDAYINLGKNTDVLHFNQFAIVHFLTQAIENFNRVIVIEGQVSPSYPGQQIHDLSKQTRETLTQLAKEIGFQYIKLEDQDLPLTADHWLDNAHVNESGRVLYTDMFADVINQQSSKHER